MRGKTSDLTSVHRRPRAPCVSSLHSVAPMPAKKTSTRTAKAPATKAPAPKTPKKKAPQSMPYEQGKWAHVFTRAAGERRYWLIKSEPDVFSFDDLRRAPKQRTGWDSVRNSTARNFLRDGMKRGDLAFYYHSNAEPSAIVGICEVVREGYADPTALDPTHDYYDAKSDPSAPTWFMVDVQAVAPLRRAISLAEVKSTRALAEIALVKQGRLSVIPITTAEWETIIGMSERDGPTG